MDVGSRLGVQWLATGGSWMSEAEKTQASAEFLIAEFNALQSHVTRLEEAKSNRVNFFLIVVAAAAAGVSGLADVGRFGGSFETVVAVAALAILGLGIATLNELVGYSESIVSLYRRGGRIRRWFVDSDVGIAPYVAFKACDDHPTLDLGLGYLGFRGGDAVVLTLNAASVSVVVAAVLSSVYPVRALVVAVVAVFAGVLAWFAQRRLIHARLRRAEAGMRKRVHFPLADEAASEEERRPGCSVE